MTEYVAGFLFDNRGHVLLIEKSKPAWQAGLWNGIGGKIEEGETPLEAMHREFFEEADLSDLKWREFATLIGEHYKVFFFFAFDNAKIWQAKTKTEEFVGVKDLRNLPPTLPNLHWLLHMALSLTTGKEQAHKFLIVEGYEENTPEEHYASQRKNAITS